MRSFGLQCQEFEGGGSLAAAGTLNAAFFFLRLRAFPNRGGGVLRQGRAERHRRGFSFPQIKRAGPHRG